VIPQAQAEEALLIAQQRNTKDAGQTLTQWRQNLMIMYKRSYTPLQNNPSPT